MIFREKFFGAENYSWKIVVIFLPQRCPVEEHSFGQFLKYLENRSIFDFFPIFFYEARRSAVFQPTCRKCMSVDNSILPVSESVPFKKQMRIFNAIFEKKKNRSIRPTHYAAIFAIFVVGTASHGTLFLVLLRECRKMIFLKIFFQHSLKRIKNEMT